MNLRKLIFTNNACYKAGRTITPKGIMVHSTGANNPNLKRYVGPDDGLLGKNQYNNHWNQDTPDGRQVCVHGFIGKLADGTIATYQTLPWNHRGWHCGSGSKGSGNDTHISFEICEDGLTDAAYFAAVYKEAAELCAYLCKQYGLTEKDIICHSEGYSLGIASNHADVMHWFPKHGKNMDAFRNDVKALLAADAPAPVQPPAPETLTDNSETIWNFLKGKGLNDYAVAGIMGNLYAESGLRPTNLQNAYESKLGFTDAAYTRAVDDGSYTNFVRDSAGYGLAQWTYWSRKQALLDFVKAVGKSIGDLNTQLAFLWNELQGYKAVLAVLQSATSVNQVSDIILTDFERPADQSEVVKAKRAGYGQGYYDKFAGKPTTPTPSSTEPPAADTMYRVRKTWGNAASQKGAFKVLENAKRCADQNPGFSVFDQTGTKIYGGTEDAAYETYVVVKGDSFWKIAADKLGNGSRYPEIKSLNGLTSDTIYAGQKLKIPQK
ncbi:hypothetical protein FACS1894132_05480 [Clostridia bacterium]|nr:hypothetical protein FACS1894132_05480 [Clostridia bacterium]